MAEPIIQKNFRLPWALAQKLEKFAKETDVTQQEIVIKALENYLKEEDLKNDKNLCC